MQPIFFESPVDFREWLLQHHLEEKEVLVGFYKRGTGRKSLTWPESVDVALCFGWIDGVRRGLGPESYSIRFTPRKKGSIWSGVNIARMQELILAGCVLPEGLRAFEARSEAKSRIYAYEQSERAEFDDHSASELKSHPEAWDFFENQPQWYRHRLTYWVMNAKKPETKAARLAKLIQACEAKTRI